MFLFNVRWVRNNWERLRRGGARAGAVAPDFRLPRLDGGELALADQRGHPLVLSFWATWCDPCREELPGIERLHRRLPRARFIAINIDNRADRVPGDPALVGATARALGLTMPIALDDGAVAATYQVTSIPETVIVDGAGVVQSVLYGAYPEADLERMIRAVR
jgi:thiol-disulfide isomerase/thioredoxin